MDDAISKQLELLLVGALEVGSPSRRVQVAEDGVHLFPA